MATPRLGLVVEDKPTELSCSFSQILLCYVHRKPMLNKSDDFTVLCHT